MKAFLNPYNRMGDCIYHLAHYMFAVGCRSDHVDQFTKFIGIIASTDHVVDRTASPPSITVVTLKFRTTVPHPKGVPVL
jgi:hypothetical protein